MMTSLVEAAIKQRLVVCVIAVVLFLFGLRAALLALPVIAGLAGLPHLARGIGEFARRAIGLEAAKSPRHAVDIFFFQVGAGGNRYLLLFSTILIFGRYIQNTVGIDIEGNFYLWNAAR